MELNSLQIVALLVFNIVTLLMLIKFGASIDISDMLREKSLPADPAVPAVPAAPGPGADVGGVDPRNTSFSRVSGFIGSIVMSTFFWGIANVLLARSFGSQSDISAIKDIVTNLGSYFAYGSALFAPYAFNQIKSMVK